MSSFGVTVYRRPRSRPTNGKEKEISGDGEGGGELGRCPKRQEQQRAAILFERMFKVLEGIKEDESMMPVSTLNDENEEITDVRIVDEGANSSPNEVVESSEECESQSENAQTRRVDIEHSSKSFICDPKDNPHCLSGDFDNEVNLECEFEKSPKVMTQLSSTQQRQGLITKPAESDLESKLWRTESPVPCKTRFYRAVYAKVSGRKHKKFDDDGYIIISHGSATGPTVTLKNMGGKIIESSTKCKLDSEMLEDGKVFKLGGKEVQISDALPSDPFTRDVKSTPNKAATKLPTSFCVTNKPFVPPVMLGPDSKTEKANKNPSKPMFDPEAPDALVLPILEPGEEDVRVVVDPHLSRHLRLHQREGVIFLYKCVMDKFSGGVILADEMGLGKTLQCITLLWTLLKQGPYQRKEIVKRALIVAPSSLVNNWEKEFQRWLGHERIKVFAVNSDHPLKHYPPQCPVIIMSYEMATRCEDALTKMRFDIILCDEAHRIKNKNAQAYLFLSKLSCRRRVLLTGTPVQNDLMELYALVDFANPGVLGSDSEFRREFVKPIEKYQESHSTTYEKQDGQAKAYQLNNILNNFFIRRTHDVMIPYLPPRVIFVIMCKPSDLQVHLYERLLSLKVVQDAFTGNVNCSTPLGVILALKKLCNHPILASGKTNSTDNSDESSVSVPRNWFPQGYRHDFLRIEDSGKMQVLVSLLKSIQAPHQKVVIVSHYTQTLDVLAGLCNMFNFQYKRLDGSTVVKQRQQSVDQFNNSSNEFIFLLSSKAGGLGLNLHGASNIILYDIDWNPSHDIQAMSRCWRPGQKKITNVFRLITSGTIEERIYHRQITKQDLSGSVTDLLLSNSNVKFSPLDLKDIFSLYKGDGCLTHELIDCDCSMDGIIPDSCTLSDVRFDDENSPPPKKKLKTIFTMAELNSWEHHGPPFINLDQEGLKQARKVIRFIFCSHSLPSIAEGTAE